jgi:hypothetical protein
MNSFRTAAVALAACAGAAHAQPELYIAEYQFQAARFTAMNPDGSNPHTLFNLPAADWLPLGVTYSPAAQRLIWTDSAGSSELKSATTAGAGYATITAVPGFARGASLDSTGRIYFSSNASVMRVDADGTGLITLYTAPSGNPTGNPRVDATNGHLYFGADGEINRTDLNGNNLKTIVRGISQPRAVALDIARGYIYWLDADTISDYLGRARLDDSDFRVLHDFSPGVVQSPGLTDLLVDPASGFVFAQDELSGQLTRVGLNGETPAVIYTNPAGYAHSGITLSTGEPAQPLRDCNNNGIHDDTDIAAGAPDCDNNGVIDTCQALACPQYTFLLDQGSDAANSLGRTVGSTSPTQLFQPFDVPAGGWNIGQIGIDGYTANYADGSGMTIKLFPDDSSTGLPNETTALATTTAPFNLRFNVNNVNWAYAPFSVALAPGRYWVRLEANQPPIYHAAVNHGTSGLPSRSRGPSGNFGNPSFPIALRLVQGTLPNTCYANCDESTTTPILNVADFTCFLQRFASGDSYANCDASTQPPVLNVADFTCYLQRFAVGCP